jgi:hypothetical protein
MPFDRAKAIAVMTGIISLLLRSVLPFAGSDARFAGRNGSSPYQSYPIDVVSASSHWL